MPTGQLIATIDCFTQEIILDVTGGTASGDFLAFYPDGTSQVLSGELPLTTSTYQDGVHTFTSTFLDLSLSTVTSVDPATLDIDCFDMSYIYICLFNLNNAYEKAKCINDKEAETEKIKLDRAMQLIALIKNFIECGVDTIQKYKEELTAITNCDNCTTLDDDIFPDSLGCTDPTANNYDPDATIDNGSCIYSGILGCTNPLANNYDPLAEYDDGSCNYDVYGCTDPTAANYDPSATILITTLVLIVMMVLVLQQYMVVQTLQQLTMTQLQIRMTEVVIFLLLIVLTMLHSLMVILIITLLLCMIVMVNF